MKFVAHKKLKGASRVAAACALALFAHGVPARVVALQVAAQAAPAQQTKPAERAAEAASALERAAVATAGGDLVNAALEYRRAFRLAPEDERGLRGYVRSVTRLGAAIVAIEQYRRRVAAQPDDRISRLLLAELLRAEARYNEALDHYDSVSRRDPANRIALRGAAAATLALAEFAAAEKLFGRDARATEARKLADRAAIRLAEGRPEAALLLVDNLSLIEGEPEALLIRADAQHRLGRYEAERVTLDRLLALHAGAAVPALERLARLLLRTGDKDALRKTCESLLAIEAANAVASLASKTIGAANVAVGTPTPAPAPDVAAAPAASVEATASTPIAPAVPASDAPAVGGSAPAVEPGDEIAPKEDDARSIARRYGNELFAGEAALFLGLSAEAATSLRRAIETRPGAPRALLALGAARLAAGDPEAAATFAAVGIVDGRRPDAQLGLAEAELRRGEPARALTLYNDLLISDPNNFRALRGRMEAFFRQGNDERAAALLLALVRQAPESEELQTRLRAALGLLGRSSRAASAPGEGRVIEPLLAAGDTVRIEITGAARFKTEARVEDDGSLRLTNLPNPVAAGCRTESEIRAELARAYARRFTENEILVRVERFRRAQLVVSGAVYLAGSYRVRARVDLPSALMLAGGATAQAGRNVYVARGVGGCREASDDGDPLRRIETYDLARLQAGEFVGVQGLTGGDLLLVPPQEAALITGAVERPGFVDVRVAPMLRDAIRSVGGTTDGARRRDLLLLRTQPNGKARQGFAINLDDIEGGIIGDVILRPDDIIEVPPIDGRSALLNLPAQLQPAAEVAR